MCGLQGNPTLFDESMKFDHRIKTCKKPQIVVVPRTLDCILSLGILQHGKPSLSSGGHGSDLPDHIALHYSVLAPNGIEHTVVVIVPACATI